MTLVSKSRLAELEKKEADAAEVRKDRVRDLRNFKLTTYGLIIAAIFGVIATYFFEKAVAVKKLVRFHAACNPLGVYFL